MILTIDMWLVIKSTLIGKMGALCVASSPVILAVEMKNNHVDALIAAIPPTLAVIVGVFALKKGQTRMFVKMDGHLTELLEVNKKASKSEGKEEERVEARGRHGEAAIAQQEIQSTPAPVPVIVENPPNKPANVKL